MCRSGGLEYLNMYPETKKWVRQCVACQVHGYDPDMPNEARGARNIRAYFPPIKFNDIDLCDQYSEHM